MKRPSRIGRPSPLFVFGAVLTAAGAVMHTLPMHGRALLLLAVGAFVVAGAAATWASTTEL